MKAWTLTIKTHGSHRALAAVQRLQPFLRQLWCPRLWLRKSHTLSALVCCLLYCCCIEISFLPSFQKSLLGCNIIIDPQDLFPASHFRVHNFSTLMTVLGILKAPLNFFPLYLLLFRNCPGLFSFSFFWLTAVLLSAIGNRSSRLLVLL